MVLLRSLIPPPAVTALLVTAPAEYASAAEQPVANFGRGANAGENAGPGASSEVRLFRPLQSLTGAAVIDSSGDQGTIVDFVADHGGQYETPGNFSYVAVRFPQINGGATYLVPSTYLTHPPQKLALNITRDELTSMPVLTDHNLPASVTSAHPGAALATTLLGATVTSDSGETLGTVKDIMVNLPHTTIGYFAVAPASSLNLSKALYAVPTGDTAKFTSGKLPLTIGEKQFADLVGFAADQMPVESGLTNFTFAPQGVYPVANKENLVDALDLSMHEEAHANRAYRAYAKVARADNQPVAADLWDTIAKVELQYHFRTDAAMG